MKLNKNVQKMVAGTLASSMLFISMAGFANAAPLTSVTATLSSLKVGALTDLDFSFIVPSGISSDPGEGYIIEITLPPGMIADSNFNNADVYNVGGPGYGWAFFDGAGTNILKLMPGSAGAFLAPGSTVHLSLGNLLYGSAHQITNPNSTGLQTISFRTLDFDGVTTVDTGTTSVYFLNNDTVSVSATVDQTITFAISENVISFGELTSANARYANSTTGSNTADVAHTLTVATNASAGYSISVNGGTLTSQQDPLNTIDAIGSTPAVSAAGTEQFGINVAASDNGTVGATFSGDFGFDAGVANTVASETVPTATETYSLTYLANIGSLTEAGSYSTNLVYVATANF